MAPAVKPPTPQIVTNHAAGEVKRPRGRPKGCTGGVKKKPVPITKIIDGKLMRRGKGFPKRVLTGKSGRPRKEYAWVEVTEKA